MHRIRERNRHIPERNLPLIIIMELCLQAMRTGKAAGPDGIQIEAYKETEGTDWCAQLVSSAEA